MRGRRNVNLARSEAETLRVSKFAINSQKYRHIQQQLRSMLNGLGVIFVHWHALS